MDLIVLQMRTLLDGAPLAWVSSVWKAVRPALELVLGDPLYLLFGVIAAQFAVVFLLILYGIALRLRLSTLARARARKTNRWRGPVLEYMEGGLDEGWFHTHIQRRDLGLFGESLQPLLLDLEGEERERLTGLLDALGLQTLLRRNLSHRNAWRRAEAVHYLGLLRAQDALPQLRKLLADPSDLVLFTVAEALMHLRDADSVQTIVFALVRRSRDNQERLSWLLLEFGPQVLPELHRMLRDELLPDWVRVILVHVMAHHLYMPATWDILDLAVHTTERELRIACVKALAEFLDPTLVGFFEERLDDEDAVVRGAAALALGRIGDETHVALLTPLLRDADFWVIKNAVDALVELGPQGEAVLRKVAFAAAAAAAVAPPAPMGTTVGTAVAGTAVAEAPTQAGEDPDASPLAALIAEALPLGGMRP